MVSGTDLNPKSSVRVPVPVNVPGLWCESVYGHGHGHAYVENSSCS
jgi:hypothetical protein